MKTVRFQLEELTCPSCIKKIEGVLNKEAGVISAKVLFNLSRVKISYDETKTDVDTLTDRVEKIGYPVLSPVRSAV